MQGEGAEEPRGQKEPDGQGEQPGCPGFELKVPAAQGKQVEASEPPNTAPEVPAGQGVQEVLPGALQEPGAQHVAAPDKLYLPAVQAMQEPGGTG